MRKNHREPDMTKIKTRHLNPNERKFVDAFADSDFTNAAAAFRKAYPASRKWDDAAVNNGAWKLQQRTHVATSVEDLRRVKARAVVEMTQRYTVSKESLGEALATIAFANIGDYASWDAKGKVVFTPSELLTPRQLGAISEIRMNSNGSVVLKLASRMDAVMNIARLAGMLGNEVKDKPDDDPEVVKQREHARKVMRDFLNRMAVPEPLTIDGTATPKG